MGDGARRMPQGGGSHGRARRDATSFDRWCRWLLVVSAGVTAFGVVMTLFGGTAFFGPVNWLFDPSFWPVSAPAVVTEFRAWVYGAWGATLVGWGIVMVFVVRGPFSAREAWAWRAIALGTGAWFVLDTGVSLAHGVIPNVIFNVVAMALVVVPLWGSRKEFR